MKYMPLIGRIYFTLIFLTSGINHILKLNQTSKFTASLGIPMPTLVTLFTGALILAGGLSILLGYKVKLGALFLLIFLIPTTIIAHRFWGVSDPAKSQIQLIMFMKNLSMIGAALMFYYFGTGPLSLEKQSEINLRSSNEN